MATAIVAYAITNLFFTQGQTTEFTKKVIFQFDLNMGMSSGEVGPGDSTSALTNEMTMRSITNAEYADIDDINITIIGYAVGTDGVSATPAELWNECKLIGNIP